MDNFDQPSANNNPSEPNPSTNQPVKDLKKANDKELTLNSKKNWFYVGLIVAILNPVFAGLIIGVFFMTEKELKKEGRIILLIAIVFAFVHTYVVQKILPFLQPGMI